MQRGVASLTLMMVGKGHFFSTRARLMLRCCDGGCGGGGGGDDSMTT